MKLIFFLFNIEGYGEFFSGITPLTDTTCDSSLYDIVCDILVL